MTRDIKHSVTIAGHRTSISLEAEFWEALKAFADEDKRSVNELIAEIDADRVRAADPRGLSSAVRVYILNRFIGMQ